MSEDGLPNCGEFWCNRKNKRAATVVNCYRHGGSGTWWVVYRYWKPGNNARSRKMKDRLNRTEMTLNRFLEVFVRVGDDANCARRMPEPKIK